MREKSKKQKGIVTISKEGFKPLAIDNDLPIYYDNLEKLAQIEKEMRGIRKGLCNGTISNVGIYFALKRIVGCCYYIMKYLKVEEKG